MALLLSSDSVLSSDSLPFSAIFAVALFEFDWVGTIVVGVGVEVTRVFAGVTGHELLVSVALLGEREKQDEDDDLCSQGNAARILSV